MTPPRKKKARRKLKKRKKFDRRQRVELCDKRPTLKRLERALEPDIRNPMMLTAIMLERGYNLSSMSRALGINRTTLREYRDGLRPIPSPTWLAIYFLLPFVGRGDRSTRHPRGLLFQAMELDKQLADTGHGPLRPRPEWLEQNT